MDGQAEGARDLIVAVFRLAVADYLGLSYGHDGPGRSRSIRPPFRSDAATFLASEWAVKLADLIGLSAPAIWTDTRRLRNQLADRRQMPRDRMASLDPADAEEFDPPVPGCPTERRSPAIMAPDLLRSAYPLIRSSSTPPGLATAVPVFFPLRQVQWISTDKGCI